MSKKSGAAVSGRPAFLCAGHGLMLMGFKSPVGRDGVVIPRKEGTLQGGPLSPLLANILLTDFDRELEKRGHRFVRYADDCNIYVQSPRSGERVFDSATRFLHKGIKNTF